MSDLNPQVVNARQPRAIVRLNGEVITGWESWEVDNNAYRSADTFRVVFVVSSLPTTRNTQWFSQQASMNVEILAGFPVNPNQYSASDLSSLIYGQVDEIAFDPVAGTIELHGRDLTAQFIDTKTSEHFANQTASQIATTLANRHGLTPVVTATTTKSGNYYKDDHASTTQQQSEWELLTFLANQEDFVLFVTGKELHFQPRPAEKADHYAITWDNANTGKGYAVSNTISLNMTRNLTIAKGVTVEVHSWNAKQKKGFTASFPKNAKGVQVGQSTAPTQVYKYTIAGLTPDKAQQRAQSLYKQIIAHEMRLTAYLPADNVLNCTQTIEMRGTCTNWDQVYYPESVKRSMSYNEGYRMEVSAKNTSPELEAAQ